MTEIIFPDEQGLYVKPVSVDSCVPLFEELELRGRNCRGNIRKNFVRSQPEEKLWHFCPQRWAATMLEGRELFIAKGVQNLKKLC